MHNNFTTDESQPTPIDVNNGVMVLYGYGITIKVDKGFLYLKDGLCGKWREGRYSRPTCKIKRLVILGHDGFITLGALKWLFDIGAGVIQLGWDGEVILATGPHKEHIAIKRSQYAAAGNSDGLEIARYLMAKKLQGQCEVLSKHAPDDTFTYQGEPLNAVRFINGHVAKIKKADSISEVLESEALTSLAYRNVISKTRLNFKKSEWDFIPAHWLLFGPRHSLVNPKANRNATNPANAMLNYLYALLHAETRIALMGAGLDPYAGIVHSDNVYRASFAYDVMEAVRPAVDRWLLDFVQSHIFNRRDFYQKPDGGVRIGLSLTPRLASTAYLWRDLLRPHIQHVARLLGRGARPR